jgi:saccharopine dehydrogenase-like NADP-dependent oxidoreductase
MLLVGAGNVGRVVARDLVLSGCRGITVVDVDNSRLAALQREHGSMVRALQLDVVDEKALAQAMKDVDVVINAASYKFNIHVLRAAIDAGCSLVDLGGLYHVTLRELRYDGRTKRAGVTAILGMGDDPGTSNILARMASWELDSVSEIRIRWGSIMPRTSGVVFGFSVATCLDEASMDAVKFSNGKRLEIPPLSDREEVIFPEPVGRQQTFAILHSELATLPRYIKGVANVTYKDSWDEATISVVEFLRASGFASDRKVTVDGVRVSPRRLLLALLSPNEPEGAVGCLLVIATGRVHGREGQVSYCLGPVKYSGKYRAPVTAYTTAVPASIVAQMLSKGLIHQRGVLPPEQLDQEQVKYFLNEMSARGLVVHKLGGGE